MRRMATEWDVARLTTGLVLLYGGVSLATVMRQDADSPTASLEGQLHLLRAEVRGCLFFLATWNRTQERSAFRAKRHQRTRPLTAPLLTLPNLPRNVPVWKPCGGAYVVHLVHHHVPRGAVVPSPPALGDSTTTWHISIPSRLATGWSNPTTATTLAGASPTPLLSCPSLPLLY